MSQSQSQSDEEGRFSPHSSDDEKLYEVIEILKESKSKYLVKWAGVDSRGKPWPDDWVPKQDVTNQLVSTWKKKKALLREKKAEKAARATSKASTARARRASTSTTPRAQRSTRFSSHTSALTGDGHREDVHGAISTTSTLGKKRRRSQPVPEEEEEEEEEQRPEPASSRPLPRKRPRLVDDQEVQPQPDPAPLSSVGSRSKSREKRSPVLLDSKVEEEEESGDISALEPEHAHGPEELQLDSQALSPGGIERLAQFDLDMMQPAQTQKSQPLFLAASDDDSDDNLLSPQRSPAKAPSLSSIPVRRAKSPVVSDYEGEYQSPSRPRASSSHRVIDQSYRSGDIPETQSASPSPLSAPKRPPKESTAGQTRRRSPDEGLAPIPMMTASRFVARAGQNGMYANEGDDLDTPMSSIEQFSSPIKPDAHAVKKLKRRSSKAEELIRIPIRRGSEAREEQGVAINHDVVVARGVELAAKAYKERRQEAAAYRMFDAPRVWQNPESQTQAATSQSVTEADGMESIVRKTEFSPATRFAMREEEEENTQDLLNERLGLRQEEEEEKGASDMEDVQEQLSEPEVQLEAQFSEHETEIEPSVDLDAAEKSAWNIEQASQRNTSDRLEPAEESIELKYPADAEDEGGAPDELGELAYPSNDDDEAAPVINGRTARTRSPFVHPSNESYELPPTASTREGGGDLKSSHPAVVLDPDAMMTLLNHKSDECKQLEAELSHERLALVAQRAKNHNLEQEIQFLQSQLDQDPRVVVTDAADESLIAERQLKDAAIAERDTLQSKLADAEKQVELFREYYGKASEFGSEKSKENKALQEQLTMAESAKTQGVALVRATFEKRIEQLQTDANSWRNQADFLRQQAIRTNDDGLRRRAAEYPELHRRYEKLVFDNEVYQDRLDAQDEDLRAKIDELQMLHEQIAELKSQAVVLDGRSQVYRCAWRIEGSELACPVFCTSREVSSLSACATQDPAMFLYPLLHFAISALLFDFARAYIYPTFPVANSRLAPGKNATLRWKDNDKHPLISEMNAVRIDLCTPNGTVLHNLAQGVDPAVLHRVVHIPNTLSSGTFAITFKCDDPPLRMWTADFTIDANPDAVSSVSADGGPATQTAVETAQTVDATNTQTQTQEADDEVTLVLPDATVVRSLLANPTMGASTTVVADPLPQVGGSEGRSECERNRRGDDDGSDGDGGG
ncbi:unnamed protein product [Mycena citricolor]|uniref:Chromo domain-containing protein n=1 Tax=Mycena citricolor TaxID=2018698 RepID=A0AAD2HG52_9AGAR|nr:unnamed protein product [Mycena citricolor]CAK5274145.1 unnamed protein product [Mycena citricolor]